MSKKRSGMVRGGSVVSLSERAGRGETSGSSYRNRSQTMSSLFLFILISARIYAPQRQGLKKAISDCAHRHSHVEKGMDNHEVHTREKKKKGSTASRHFFFAALFLQIVTVNSAFS